MKKFYPLIFLFLALLSGCTKPDTTPAWLVINEFDLQTDEVTEGSDSEGISDAWVYMDNQPLGVFSIPARIPVLAEGQHEFTIYAGIKQNGISATRVRYPFYNSYNVSLFLVKEQEIVVTPIITYKTSTQFQLIEDFENIGISFEKSFDSDTDLVVLDAMTYPTIVKYGDFCGALYLDQVDSFYQGLTNTNLNLPGLEEVYVEIDFMNTNSVGMGVIAENVTGVAQHPPLVVMNPQDPATMKWKKIYISLKDDISYEINATSFEIYLTGILDPGESSGVVYLDNIKVLRFE